MISSRGISPPTPEREDIHGEVRIGSFGGWNDLEDGERGAGGGGLAVLSQV